jgi:hypothetical protein
VNTPQCQLEVGNLLHLVGDLSLKGRVGDSRLCLCVQMEICVTNRFAIRFPSARRGKSAIANAMFRRSIAYLSIFCI